jgi:putative ABC transport system substrate-binding protein
VFDGDLELSAKRLEILKEIASGLKRVLFPYDPGNSDAVTAARVYRDAARSLGLVLVEKPVRTEDEARTILTKLRKADVDGIVAQPIVSLNIPGFILDAALQRAIPTMFNGPFFVERGGLISYGPDWHESGRLAARLVDKIVKGEDPGRIPVEANSKIDLAINMKTAKALKLVIPPSVLQRASRLVE